MQLVALDSLYPGWDGLDAGVELAREQILVPHARGLVGVWQRWDWDAGATAEAHAVDPSLPLIVEGSGILNPVTARLSDLRVWLESPLPVPQEPRARARRRDLRAALEPMGEAGGSARVAGSADSARDTRVRDPLTQVLLSPRRRPR